MPEAIAARSSSMRRARLVALGGEGHRARLELGAGFLEPLDLGGQRDGAFDERRVSGAGFGRALTELLGGLARLEQAALRRRQPFVGRPLIVFETRDRLARFVLTAVDRLALLFGLPALAGELLALLGEAGRFVLGVLQLRLLGHDGFFLLVMLGRQRGDGVATPVRWWRRGSRFPRRGGRASRARPGCARAAP